MDQARVGWLTGGRGRLGVVAAVAVALVAAGAVVAVGRGSGDDPGDRAPVARAPKGPTSPPVLLAANRAAPDGGEVRIVEQGFTQRYELVALTLTPGYGPGKPEPYMPAYTAIILENTSRSYAAMSVAVTIRYLDQAGRGIVEYGAKTDEKVLTTIAIGPGERRSVADHLNVSEVRAVTLTATVAPPGWMTLPDAQRDDNYQFSRVTASDVTVLRTGSAKVIVVAFNAHSGSDRRLQFRTYVIFRDASGKLLGAIIVPYGENQVFLSGDTEGSVTITDWFPPTMDERRTEVQFGTA